MVTCGGLARGLRGTVRAACVNAGGRQASPGGVGSGLDSSRGSLLGCRGLGSAWQQWLMLVVAALLPAAGADARALAPADPQASAEQVAPGGSPLDRAEVVRRRSCESREDLEYLLARLEDAEPLVRGTALSRLLAAPRERLVELLGRAPVSSRGEGTARLIAVLALEETSLVRYWSICSAVTGQQDPWLRSVLAEACVAGGQPGEEVMARLVSDPHWSVRARVALVLAERGREEDRLWLEMFSRDGHPTVRRAARAGRTPR